MRLSSVLTMALSFVCVAGTSMAGSPNALCASDETAASGAATVTISGDFPADIIQGWSFGLCNGGDVVATAVADGSTTAAFNGGDGADFNQVNLFADGWTVGVVIAFLGMDSLAPGTGYELYLADYDALTVVHESAPDVVAPLDFCDTLGVPPVATVVVSGGASLTPDRTEGSITIPGVTGIPAFIYIAGNESRSYDPANGMGSATVGYGIVQDPSSAEVMDFPADTQGFSMGNGCDSNVASPTGVSSTGELASVNGGEGPDFFGQGLFAGGWTIGVVHAFLGGVFIQYDVEKTVIEVSYASNAGALTGDMDGASTALAWSGSIGRPPVANVVVVGGASVATGSTDGSLEFLPVSTTDFIRGDCNEDSIVDVADGIWTLNRLFLGGPTGNCNEACDSNDDGMVDSSDATFIFNYRFLSGPAPSAPFPDCGDGGGDPETQDCAGHDAC